MKAIHSLRHRLAGCALVAAALAVSLQPAAGQVGQGPGWSAWLGCWEHAAVVDPAALAGGSAPSLCFLPTDDPTRVELVTVTGSEITERQLLDASGAARPAEREGCSGVESMEWSADGQRVFQKSTYDCPGALHRESSGAFVIDGRGDWVDVAAVSVGEATNVRVIRYRPARGAERVGEIARALEGRAMAMETARASAATRIDLADVTEALSRIDAAAVEGWLIESGQGFSIDRAKLVALADAGVPARVVDLMVALSYPNRFAIDRTAREGEAVPGEPDVGYRGLGMMDPWGYGYPYGSYYGRGYYPGYLYSDPYFYDPYYSGLYGRGYGFSGGWYDRPVIVVREPEPEDTGGRAVNGMGYTRRRSDGGTGSPSGPSDSVGRSGSSGGSASPGGYGGSDSGSSGGSGRTAKPRD